MKDSEFLQWVHDRMKEVYKENENYDYMHRLRRIIQEADERERKQSPPKVRKQLSSEDQLKEMQRIVGRVKATAEEVEKILNHPHPGLFTWAFMFGDRIKELGSAIDELHKFQEESQ